MKKGTVQVCGMEVHVVKNVPSGFLMIDGFGRIYDPRRRCFVEREGKPVTLQSEWDRLVNAANHNKNRNEQPSTNK